MTTELRHPPETKRPALESRNWKQWAPGSGSGQSLFVAGAGGVGLVLGFVGLLGLVPMTLDGLGVLVLAGGLSLEAALAIAAVKRLSIRSEWGSTRSTGGFTTELVFGLLGAGLAILALAKVNPMTLISLGATATGIALWAGSASMHAMSHSESEEPRPGKTAMSGPAASGVTLGFLSVILGILALDDVRPRDLTLISNMIVGCGLVISGITFSRTPVERRPRSPLGF